MQFIMHVKLLKKSMFIFINLSRFSNKSNNMIFLILLRIEI